MKNLFYLLFAGVISVSAIGCGGETNYEAPPVTEEDEQKADEYAKEMENQMKGGGQGGK